jgi:hypothetical protein
MLLPNVQQQTQKFWMQLIIEAAATAEDKGSTFCLLQQQQ